jgi:aspartyl-tRNA(Asn)/glutamyl-tRNA(Gln) amidotransferase subunit C
MISQDEIKHIAQLAHLELNSDELKSMEKELSLILDYFNSLKELDLGKVKPAFYLREKQSLSAVTREDIVKEKKGINEKLKEASPQREKDYLKVKKVI